MDYDKIKIYATKRVAEILEKDAENFYFLKKDGITPNKNAFLSTLIINYSDQFNTKQANLVRIVEKTINQQAYLNSNKVQSISQEIVNQLNNELANDLVDKFDALISLKPTKETLPIISYIENYLLANCSLSKYFRDMFVDYTSLPQDMREKIIFQEQYALLSEAINKKQKVFITTKGATSKMEISPYAFSHSKEEMHIYLIFKQGNSCRSIKLSKIESVTILKSNSTFIDADISIFQKMLKYGVQFFYNASEEEVIVKLTPRGQKLFHKIYLHRPIPSKVENDTFYFNCSHTQIVQYFIRFGSDVEIISPEKIRNDIFNFHYSFIKKYEKMSF